MRGRTLVEESGTRLRSTEEIWRVKFVGEHTRTLTKRRRPILSSWSEQEGRRTSDSQIATVLELRYKKTERFEQELRVEEGAGTGY